MGKVVVWFMALFNISLLAFIIIVTPSRISQFLYDRSEVLRQYKYGWLLLSVIFVVASFPPLVGNVTIISLCGFAYGIKGFFIAAPAAWVGSIIVFSVLRVLFSRRIKQWSSKNEKWQALEAVIEEKGLPLIILIRASPFPPWVYSNTLFAVSVVCLLAQRAK